MPHAFQVLTRFLHALCSYIILGLCFWYVDDLMAVSPISSYLTDSSKVDKSVQHLLVTMRKAAQIFGLDL